MVMRLSRVAQKNAMGAPISALRSPVAGYKSEEAPNGLEPLNKGFADPPLSHLGTAP